MALSYSDFVASRTFRQLPDEDKRTVLDRFGQNHPAPETPAVPPLPWDTIASSATFAELPDEDKKKLEEQHYRQNAAFEVRREAVKQGVNPALMASLLTQESGGDPTAMSPMGATGLMQLMEGAATDMGVDPTIPSQNVRGGVGYFKRQLDDFGDEDAALAAYYAGPGRVREAMAAQDDWLGWLDANVTRPHGQPLPSAYVSQVRGRGEPVAALPTRPAREPAMPAVPAPPPDTALPGIVEQAQTGAGQMPRFTPEQFQHYLRALAPPGTDYELEYGPGLGGMAARTAGNLASGFATLFGGLADIVPYVADTLTSDPGEYGATVQGFNDFADFMREKAQELSPADPQFVDKAIAGLATSIGFMIPGTMFARAAYMIPKISPLIATAIGVGAATIEESMMEGADVYDGLLKQGMAQEEAESRAHMVTVKNIATLAATNAAGGLFNPTQRSIIRRAFQEMPAGAVEEGLQEVWQLQAQDMPVKDHLHQVSEAAALGGVISGTMGAGLGVYDRMRGGLPATPEEAPPPEEAAPEVPPAPPAEEPPTPEEAGPPIPDFPVVEARPEPEVPSPEEVIGLGLEEERAAGMADIGARRMAQREGGRQRLVDPDSPLNKQSTWIERHEAIRDMERLLSEPGGADLAAQQMLPEGASEADIAAQKERILDYARGLIEAYRYGPAPDTEGGAMDMGAGRPPMARGTSLAEWVAKSGGIRPLAHLEEKGTQQYYRLDRWPGLLNKKAKGSIEDRLRDAVTVGGFNLDPDDLDGFIHALGKDVQAARDRKPMERVWDDPSWAVREAEQEQDQLAEDETTHNYLQILAPYDTLEDAYDAMVAKDEAGEFDADELADAINWAGRRAHVMLHQYGKRQLRSEPDLREGQPATTPEQPEAETTAPIPETVPPIDDTMLPPDETVVDVPILPLEQPTAEEIAQIEAEQAATSPENDIPEPTDPQKQAGNYRKGHIKLHGMDISIENPKGSTRSGTDPDGEGWSVVMPASYGYIRRSLDADGEQVDVYVGEQPESDRVFVVDQRDLGTGVFDEHKAFLGFLSQQEVEQTYDAAFDDGRGPERRAAITEMSIDEFKTWLKEGNTQEPIQLDAVDVAVPPAPEPTPTPVPEPEAAVEPTVPPTPEAPVAEPEPVVPAPTSEERPALTPLPRPTSENIRDQLRDVTAAAQQVVDESDGELLHIAQQVLRDMDAERRGKSENEQRDIIANAYAELEDLRTNLEVKPHGLTVLGGSRETGEYGIEDSEGRRMIARRNPDGSFDVEAEDPSLLTDLPGGMLGFAIPQGDIRRAIAEYEQAPVEGQPTAPPPAIPAPTPTEPVADITPEQVHQAVDEAVGQGQWDTEQNPKFGTFSEIMVGTPHIDNMDQGQRATLIEQVERGAYQAWQEAGEPGRFAPLPEQPIVPTPEEAAPAEEVDITREEDVQQALEDVTQQAQETGAGQVTLTPPPPTVPEDARTPMERIEGYREQGQRFEQLKAHLADMTPEEAGRSSEVSALGIQAVEYIVTHGPPGFQGVTQRMVDMAGEAVRPHLDQWYNFVRDLPDVPAGLMDSAEKVAELAAEPVAKPTVPPAPAPEQRQISPETAKKLLALPAERSTHPFGPALVELRRDILEELTGTRPPKSKAGAQRVQEALYASFGVDPEQHRTLKDAEDTLLEAMGNLATGRQPATTPEPTTPPVAPTPAPAAAPAPATQVAEQPRQLIERMQTRLVAEEKTNNKELGQMSREIWGTDQINPKDQYDAVEVALAKTIEGRNFPDDARRTLFHLSDLTAQLPVARGTTPTARKYQQYSTPPRMAYAVNWLANITPGETVLEPSAGTGQIAVWAKKAGARVVVNEFETQRDPADNRQMPRSEALAEIGFDRILSDDAKYINTNPDVKSEKITTVVMNPPFSSDPKAKASPDIPKRHVESALNTLEPGGRLVAIVGGGRAKELGQGMADNAPQFKDWWKRIKGKYNVRANVQLSGKEYQKFGTSFLTRILVIDKTGKTPNNQVEYTGYAETVEELVDLLQDVRDGRTKPDVSPRGEQPLAQPEGARTPVREQPEPSPGPATQPDAPVADEPTPDRVPDRGVAPGGDRVGTAGRPTGTRPATPGRGEGRRPGDQRTPPRTGGQPTEPAGPAVGDTPRPEPGRPKPGSRLVSDERMAELEARLRKKAGGTQLNMGLDYETLRDGIELSVAYIERGLRKFADFVKRMVDVLGDGIKTSLKALYNGARNYLGKMVSPELQGEADAIAAEMDTAEEVDRLSDPAELDRILAPEEAPPAEDAAPEPEPEQKELSDNIWEDYQPRYIRDALGNDPLYSRMVSYPGALVESAAMNAVEMPPLTYRPNLAERTVVGAPDVPASSIAETQIEAIAYAGQAHEQVLPDGTRQGFMIGDGTGVGKTREIIGIILDNFNQGRKKAVVVSENKRLLPDLIKEWTAVTGDPEPKIADLATMATSRKRVDADFEGVLFTTYATLRNDKDLGEDAEVSGPSPFIRVEQVIDWFGEDFDGVVAFDETHNMSSAGNVTGSSGGREKKVAKQARAGTEMQDRLSNARFLYLSATAAVEVSAFLYARHLGLWGPGKPFSSGEDFADKMVGRGTGGLELVANNLKAAGRYMARTLALQHPTDPDLSVSYETMIHEATESQREMYDKIAESWQMVVREMEAAATITNTPDAKGVTQIWSAQQRFFSHLLIAMAAPSVLRDAQKQIEAGNAVLVSLTDTNEALANRKRSEMQEGQREEDLDLSPRDVLMRAVDKNFPSVLYEKDEKDNLVPVENPNYDPEKPMSIPDNHPYRHDPEALAAKEKVMDELADIPMPEGFLEQLFTATYEDGPNVGQPVFTPDNVAEVTGRKERTIIDPETGQRVSQTGRGTDAVIAADVKAYMDDEKQLLVYSKKGGTGMSYHASLNAKNQRKRIHYVVQPGWQADIMKQQLGRSHRANERFAPHVVLATTDLPAQRRFLSTIARRLDSMGALTAGQRETGSQGLFGATDNLEGKYAVEAKNLLFDEINRGVLLQESDETVDLDDDGTMTAAEMVEEADEVADDPSTWPPLSIQGLAWKMGLHRKMLDADNQYQSAKDVEMKQLLNRIMMLIPSEQEAVFNLFSRLMNARIDKAIADGTYDAGMETIKDAISVEKRQDEVVRKDERTGATVRYVMLDVEKPSTFQTLDAVRQRSSAKPLGVFRNVQSGQVWYAFESQNHVTQGGERIEKMHALYSVGGTRELLSEDDFRSSHTRGKHKGQRKLKPIPQDQWEDVWLDAIDKAPATKHVGYPLLVGQVLDVWDSVTDPVTKIVRAQVSSSGERLLGQTIRPKFLPGTLKNLGVNAKEMKLSNEQVMNKVRDEGAVAHLSNGWQITRKMYNGEYRVELLGKGGGPIKFERLADLKALTGPPVKLEGIRETSSRRTRLFFPLDPVEQLKSLDAYLGPANKVVRVAEKATPEEVETERAQAQQAENDGPRYSRQYAPGEQMADQPEAANIDAIAARMVPGASVTTEGELRDDAGDPISGVFETKDREQIIKIALSGNPVEHLGHETIHALKQAGLFTDAEWAGLERTAEEFRWLENFEIATRYPRLNKTAQLEEAIASAFGRWITEGQVAGITRDAAQPSILRQLFERVRMFFRDVGRALRGRDTAVAPTNLFEEIWSGVRAAQLPTRQPATTPHDSDRFETGAETDRKYARTMDAEEQGAVTGEGPSVPVAARGWAAHREEAKNLVKRGLGTTKERLQAILGKEKGEAIYYDQLMYGIKKEMAATEIGVDVMREFTDTAKWERIKNIPVLGSYLGERGTAATTALIRNRLKSFSGQFGVRASEKETLFEASEAANHIDMNGDVVWGTEDIARDSSGRPIVGPDGEPVMKTRYTPEQGRERWDKLSDSAREALVYWVNMRDQLKEHYKVESDIQGYVHHYFPSHKELFRLTEGTLLKHRTAGPRKFRKGVEGFEKDLEKSIIRYWTVMEHEKLWNEYVGNLIDTATEPINDKNPLKEGWKEIPKNEFSRRGVVIGKLGGGRQVPAEFYEDFMRFAELTDQTSTIVDIVRGIGRFFKTNMLLHPGTAATNMFSGAIQYMTKVVEDFWRAGVYMGQWMYAGLNGKPKPRNLDVVLKRLVTNITAPLEALRPSVIENLPHELFGAQSNVRTQFGPAATFMDRLNNVLLWHYGAIENYWKRTIMVSELKAQGITISPDLLEQQEQALLKINDVIDTYAFNYANQPRWITRMKQHWAGALAFPFPTYPYKLGHLYARYVSSLNPFSWKHLDGGYAEGMARALTLLSVLGLAMGLMDDEEKDRVGPWVPGMASALDKTGRMHLTALDEKAGTERWLRTIKYPWLNLVTGVDGGGKILTALWEERSPSEGMGQMSAVMQDMVGEGPLVAGLALLTGYGDEFSQYKTTGTRLGELAASFFPATRINQDWGTMSPGVQQHPTTFLQAFVRGTPIPDRWTGLGKVREDKASLINGQLVLHKPTLNQLKFWLGINMREIDVRTYQYQKRRTLVNIIKAMSEATTIDAFDRAVARLDVIDPKRAVRLKRQLSRRRILIEKMQHRRIKMFEQRAERQAEAA